MHAHTTKTCYFLLLAACCLLLPALARCDAAWSDPRTSGNTLMIADARVPGAPAAPDEKVYRLTLRYLTADEINGIFQRDPAVKKYLPAGIISLDGVKGTHDILVKSATPQAVIDLAPFLALYDKPQPRIAVNMVVVVTGAKEYLFTDGQDVLPEADLYQRLRALIAAGKASVVLPAQAVLISQGSAYVTLPPLLGEISGFYLTNADIQPDGGISMDLGTQSSGAGMAGQPADAAAPLALPAQMQLHVNSGEAHFLYELPQAAPAKEQAMTTMVIALAKLLPISAPPAATPSAVSAKQGGTLDASGAGYGSVNLQTGTVACTFKGDLWVSKVSAAAQYKVDFAGKPVPPQTLPNGQGVCYQGVNGAVTITGKMIVVTVQGAAITLKATGVGSAMLFGAGAYTALDNADPTTKHTGAWFEQPNAAPPGANPATPIPFGAVGKPGVENNK